MPDRQVVTQGQVVAGLVKEVPRRIISKGLLAWSSKIRSGRRYGCLSKHISLQLGIRAVSESQTDDGYEVAVTFAVVL